MNRIVFKPWFKKSELRQFLRILKKNDSVLSEVLTLGVPKEKGCGWVQPERKVTVGGKLF